MQKPKIILLLQLHCKDTIRELIPYKNAQVAELVDALVSNTNEVTLVPVRPRPWVQKVESKSIERERSAVAFFLFVQLVAFHSKNIFLCQFMIFEINRTGFNTDMCSIV